jgi:WD40 repeat protein
LDPATGTSTGRINVADHHISSLSYSSEGKLLAFLIREKQWGQEDILLYDTVLRLKQGVLRTAAGPISNLAFSPDGRLLAAATWGHRVEIWDTQTALLQEALNMRHNIMRAEFSADGHILACSSQELQSSTTYFWDFRLGTDASSVDSNHRGAFSPVAKLFAFVPTYGEVCLWNVEQHALHNRWIGLLCPVGE